MNPIIDKIKKLLRLGRNSGASAAEAATALQKAQQLAAEHGVDLDAIPVDQDGYEGISHVTEKTRKGVAQRFAASIVKRHFSVETLFVTKGKWSVIHFVGAESNCQIAAYVYVYLTRAMNQAWRTRINRRLRDRESFIRGFAYAVDQIMPEKFHQPALIVVTERYIDGVILAGMNNVKDAPLKPFKKNLSDSALREGIAAGKKAGIHNAVRGTNTELIA